MALRLMGWKVVGMGTYVGEVVGVRAMSSVGRLFRQKHLVMEHTTYCNREVRDQRSKYRVRYPVVFVRF